jgi:hypothetical protein
VVPAVQGPGPGADRAGSAAADPAAYYAAHHVNGRRGVAGRRHRASSRGFDTAVLDTAVLDTAVLDTAVLDTAVLDTGRGVAG